MLKWSLENVELTPVAIKQNEINRHAHAVVSELMKQKPNGPTSRTSRALPWPISLVIRRWGRGKGTEHKGVNLGTKCALLCIASVNAADQGFQMRMLGNVAPQAHDSPHQHFSNRVKIGGGRSVKAQGVRREVIIRGNGLGNGCVKKPHGRDAVRGGFAAVEASSNHQSTNDRLFSVIAPREMGHFIGQACGNSQPFVERPSKK